MLKWHYPVFSTSDHISLRSLILILKRSKKNPLLLKAREKKENILVKLCAHTPKLNLFDSIKYNWKHDTGKKLIFVAAKHHLFSASLECSVLYAFLLPIY
jgi:hypothetical protein